MRKSASFLALMFTGMISAATQAADTSHFQFAANSINGDFVNGTDCRTITATIVYDDAVNQTSGKPVDVPVLFADVNYVDVCSTPNINMTFTGVATAVQSANVRNDLSTASLVAQIPVSDGAGTTITLSINLTFGATADISTIRNTFHSHDAGLVFNTRSSSSSRPGILTGMLSGSFPTSGGGYQTFNIAEFGSVDASVTKNNFGDVTIIKK